MSATPVRSVRPGASERVSGGLRKPAMVRAADYDELTIELAAMRHEATDAADYLEPRLDFLFPISIEIGPAASQVVLGCLHRVDRLRKRAAQ